ncbi:MAG: amidohydrolase [Hyphomicrobiales bacterium]|nr:amidohydrolase [Hyphomicrobiales bacterium]MBV9519060.1 amidohydrolase [Hyphomicrobiales bacterium]
MRKVIDLECDLPPDEKGNPRKIPGAEHPPGHGAPEKLASPPGYGFANYENIFRSRAAAPDPSHPKGESIDSVVARMKKANIVRGVVGRIPNADLVTMVKQHPDSFICLAEFSAYDGMRAVRGLQDIVQNHGIHGFRTSSLYTMLPASDRRYYPLYAKCVELDIPVRIYTAMSYANDRPYDLGHPRHLDQICMDFPELRVVAGLGGWPWVNEMVALLRRHPNLYCDTASHRPRHFATPGSGWEMFLQFGNTLLQDKIMIGLSRQTFGGSYEDLIAEYEALPLRDSVKDKWFYSNAARFFRIE